MSTLSEIPYLDHIRNINLIPFHYDDETSSHLSEVLENVMIFIPLGVYLKMLKITDAKAILLGMTFSLGLEILQFILAVGASDITDIMTNTAGAAIGVGIYAILSLVFRKSEKLDKVLCILASIFTILLISMIAILLFAN
jgi:glycopeptide antibiotics resistance protein